MRSKRLSNRGFSAIQFFLVVAIASIVVYVLYAFFAEARLEARNAVRNETIEEYTRVLALLHADRGTYPKLEASCLGDYADDRCFILDFNAAGDIRESSALNARLQPFIELRAGDVITGVRGDGAKTAYEGYIYRSPEDSTYGYMIEWILEGDDARCGLNADAAHRPNGFNLTHCTYTAYER